VQFWAVFGVALAIRALLLPIPNTDDDVVFQTWSRVVTVEGFHTIYDVYDPIENVPRECQYPPAYLYVLWLAGTAYQQLLSPAFVQETIAFLMILRIPTVLADMALGCLIFVVVGRWWGARAALWAFAAHALSPAMILDSTIITQIDSVQALVMVSTVLLLATGRHAASIACLALAALTKPQAVILAPLVLMVVIRSRDWSGLIRGGLGAAGVFGLLAIPFMLNDRMPELIRTLVTPVGTAPYLSLNAFNLWWLVSLGNGWRLDTVPIAGPVTPRLLGLALFGIAVGLALYRLYRDQSRDSILLSAAFISLAFFVVCTEMTERYVIAALPFVLLLAPSARTFVTLYGILAATAFVNLYAVFPLVQIAPWDALRLPHSNYFFYVQRDSAALLQPLVLFSRKSDALLPLWIGAIHVIVLVYLATLVWPGRRRSVAPASA
jgi:Gpi18-like mannosyltransferase